MAQVLRALCQDELGRCGVIALVVVGFLSAGCGSEPASTGEEQEIDISRLHGFPGFKEWSDAPMPELRYLRKGFPGKEELMSVVAMGCAAYADARCSKLTEALARVGFERDRFPEVFEFVGEHCRITAREKWDAWASYLDGMRAALSRHLPEDELEMERGRLMGQCAWAVNEARKAFRRRVEPVLENTAKLIEPPGHFMPLVRLLWDILEHDE